MCSVVQLTCGKGIYSKDDLTKWKMTHRPLLQYRYILNCGFFQTRIQFGRPN